MGGIDGVNFVIHASSLKTPAGRCDPVLRLLPTTAGQAGRCLGPLFC